MHVRTTSSLRILKPCGWSEHKATLDIKVRVATILPMLGQGFSVYQSWAIPHPASCSSQASPEDQRAVDNVCKCQQILLNPILCPDLCKVA